VDVGQTEVASLVLVGEFLVIDSEEPEYPRVQVVNRDEVFLLTVRARLPALEPTYTLPPATAGDDWLATPPTFVTGSARSVALSMQARFPRASCT
jgi:hypothetical protein